MDLSNSHDMAILKTVLGTTRPSKDGIRQNKSRQAGKGRPEKEGRGNQAINSHSCRSAAKQKLANLDELGTNAKKNRNQPMFGSSDPNRLLKQYFKSRILP